MKKRNLLLSAIAMLLVAVVGLTSASFAWFKFSTATEVEGIKMDVKSDKSLSIGLAYNGTYKQKITFPELAKANLHLPTAALGVPGTLDAATPVTTANDKSITVANKAITFMGLKSDATGLQADTTNFISAKMFLKATVATGDVKVQLDTANLFTFDNAAVTNYSMRIVDGEVRYICGEHQVTTANDAYVYTLKPVVNGVTNKTLFYYTDAVDKTEVPAADFKVALDADNAVQAGVTGTAAITVVQAMANSALQKEIAKSLRIAFVCTPVLLADGNIYDSQPTTLVVYEPDTTDPSILGDLVLNPADYPDYNNYVTKKSTDLVSTSKLDLFTITNAQIKADVCWEVTTYVWIEGFDTACSNYVTGSAFNTWLKFTAAA